MTQTHFGFKNVEVKQKAALVSDVFSSVARKYDLMNDAMSGAMHRLWKNQMIEQISLNIGQNYQAIDVAGGTGDIAFRLLKKAQTKNASVAVTIADINQQMLEVGKSRAVDKNLFKTINFQCCDGEKLPYNDNHFDIYTIAFGIRNFTNVNAGLSEAFRVLKPGGVFLCLEFSQVDNLLLAKIYNAYSFKVIPKIGQLLTGDRASYQYLVESIRQFPNQETFEKMIEQAGFKNVSYLNLSFGVAAIHSGFK